MWSPEDLGSNVLEIGRSLTRWCSPITRGEDTFKVSGLRFISAPPQVQSHIDQSVFRVHRLPVDAETWRTTSLRGELSRRKEHSRWSKSKCLSSRRTLNVHTCYPFAETSIIDPPDGPRLHDVCLSSAATFCTRNKRETNRVFSIECSRATTNNNEHNVSRLSSFAAWMWCRVTCCVSSDLSQDSSNRSSLKSSLDLIFCCQIK